MSLHDLAWRWVTVVAGPSHVIINAASRILNLGFEISAAHFWISHTLVLGWLSEFCLRVVIW